jgi:site-specific DNA-cytosine methylase
VVLSLFGGIGTALVALKRLDIDIKRHVHVEHNSVATHVVRNNHDSLYNPQLPNDGIVHTYVNKFEDFSVEMALEYGRKLFLFIQAMLDT